MERTTELADLTRRATEGERLAAEAILTELTTGSPAEQFEIVRMLYVLDNVTFWERVIEYLARGTWAGQPVQPATNLQSVQRTKMRALFLAGAGSSGELARETAIAQCIASADENVAGTAFDLAGMSRSPRLVDPLISTAIHSNGHRQIEAIRALGELGDPHAVPALVEVLHAENDRVAAAAKDALALIGAPAVEPLAQILVDQRKPEQVRWLAARGLAKIGDRDAIPALIHCLNDESYSIRWASADALIATGAEGVRATLQAIATRPIPGGLADAAAHVLAHARNNEVKHIVKPVVEALRQPGAEWAAPLIAGEALDKLVGIA